MCSTNFKLLTQIKENLINSGDFLNLWFPLWQPLWLLTVCAKTPSYATVYPNVFSVNVSTACFTRVYVLAVYDAGVWHALFLRYFRERYLLVESQKTVAATALTHSNQLHCRRCAHGASKICFSDIIRLQSDFSANKSISRDYTREFYIPPIRRWSLPRIQ